MRGTRFRQFRSEKLLLRNIFLIVVLVAAIGLLTLFAYFYLDDIYLLKERGDLQAVAEDISMMDLSDREKLETELSDIEAKHNFYIELYYPRDQLIYTTNTNQATFDPQPADEEKKETLASSRDGTKRSAKAVPKLERIDSSATTVQKTASDLERI